MGLGLIFPRTCPICADIVTPAGALICADCARRLPLVRQPVCKKCGKEILSELVEYCLDCSRHPRSFEAGMALLNYDEMVGRSMAEIKYKNRREYLDFYAEALSIRYRKQIGRIRPDLLIPVPVHASRKRSRGFNQAEELAKRLGKLWALPVNARFLVRGRKTNPQKELSPSERLKNLQDAFECRHRALEGDVPNTVILIDDIYTTGSTVEACTRILKAAGVERVYVTVICIGSGRD